ncbi:hypothetical protein N0V93_009710 [Gnomoniopsis smithogilvyi]|uniref:Uncharacterized protein n=1 Tax=Gnomoniopsis smithogilvyi TaxID=1191159 RepID=A0A9W8YNN3_9PEZI|nr:hypothetical protein N0V93_009710 [Gnomoniopsis smithogilvyi]
MPRPYTLRPESFVPPNPFSPYIHISFRLPYESRDPIYPASGLQLSFARPSDDQEIFLERITARDVQYADTGLCTVLLEKDSVPRYNVKELTEEEVLVKLHAWKGERHLGAWEVGRLHGEDAYKVVS